MRRRLDVLSIPSQNIIISLITDSYRNDWAKRRCILKLQTATGLRRRCRSFSIGLATTLVSQHYAIGFLTNSFIHGDMSEYLGIKEGTGHVTILLEHLARLELQVRLDIHDLLNNGLCFPGGISCIHFSFRPSKAISILHQKRIPVVNVTATESDPQTVPGKKSHYTDTNYHLLGLIVENVCGEPFHAVLKKLVFDPVGMSHAYMLHYSEPEKASPYPEAGFYIDQTRLNDVKGLAGIDHAGGGVVAPLEDLLLFMKALVGHQLVSKETLEIMKDDKARFIPGFEYGYGIWQERPIPLLIPTRFQSWGVLGATGAFMFYHPELNAYVIGNFNHIAWQRKCVRFMFRVMDKLRD